MFKFKCSWSSTQQRTGFVLLALLGTALLVTCTPAEVQKKPWREELIVIVVQGESNVDTEFKQQLVNLFGKQLQVKVRLLPLPPDQIMPALMANRAHIAAAGLRSNENAGMRFAPSYQTVQEQVVCKGTPPKHLDELLNRAITVVAGSAQEAVLREAQNTLAPLRWERRNNQTVPNLLSDVAAGKLDCTIANEEQLALARNYAPNLDAAFDIAAPSKLAWAFSPDSDAALVEESKKFFGLIKQDGTLRRLLDRYYGHNERLEAIDSVTFITKARTDLPHLRPLFEEGQNVSGIDWRLLAAISYHESHWNPLATSSTNVRGLMMLTEETADRMKVTDRLDPRQSILAGARYLRLLQEELPRRIANEERIWLGLAAYNQGQGHLEDARVLTARAKLNADTWLDVKKMMPLLTQPEYFEQTKHGYARGGEAVILVETVRLYYDMLKHLDTHEMPNLQTSPFRLKLPGASKLPGNTTPKLP